MFSFGRDEAAPFSFGRDEAAPFSFGRDEAAPALQALRRAVNAALVGGSAEHD